MKQSKNETSKSKKGWYVVFGLVGAIIFAQLIVSGAWASKGEELNKLDAKVVKLAKENQELQADLSSKASLQELSAKAQELGFVKQNSIVYVDLTHSVAALPQNTLSSLSR